MRKLSKVRSPSLYRLIDKIQRIAGHFEQITFFHILHHLNSEVDAMENRGALLNRGQLLQNWGGVGGIILQYLHDYNTSMNYSINTHNELMDKWQKLYHHAKVLKLTPSPPYSL
jgi:hypothetical protein